jgi:hypothetical protein
MFSSVIMTNCTASILSIAFAKNRQLSIKISTLIKKNQKGE